MHGPHAVNINNLADDACHIVILDKQTKNWYQLHWMENMNPHYNAGVMSISIPLRSMLSSHPQPFSLLPHPHQARRQP